MADPGYSKEAAGIEEWPQEKGGGRMSAVIKTVKGDITKIADVQAIVNAAKEFLSGCFTCRFIR